MSKCPPGDESARCRSIEASLEKGGTGTAGSSGPQSQEAIVTKVRQRLRAEPASRALLYKVLVLCETPRSAVELDSAITAFPEMKVALHSPAVLLSWLVEAGGVEQVGAGEGEVAWRTTAAGLEVVHTEGPAGRIQQLLAAEPVYRSIYLQVLQSCAVPRSRTEIEAMLKGHLLLEAPRVFPSYFIEALERAGGLEWDEKWRTTPAGREFVG